MNQINLSVGDMASALGGAGLVQLNNNLNIALILIGAAVALKVLVAVLNKSGIGISSVPVG